MSTEHRMSKAKEKHSSRRRLINEPNRRMQAGVSTAPLRCGDAEVSAFRQSGVTEAQHWG
jgi:hypothetical protein